MLSVEIFAFGIALWLGFYLISREPKNPRLLLAGLGLVSYSLSFALDMLAAYASPEGASMLARLHWPLLFFPAIFWTGALDYFMPENFGLRPLLIKGWQYGLLPFGLVCLLTSFFTNWLVDTSVSPARTGPLYPVFSGVVLLSWLGVLLLAWKAFGPIQLKNLASLRNLTSLPVLVGLFFGLSTALLLLPLDWLPHAWVVLSLGFDLVVLGLTIAVKDAFEQGEAFLPDFFRSFDFSLVAALFFGGQVAFVMWLATGVNLPMLALLLAVIATAIASQTFASQLQAGLDKIAFASFPRLLQARADLRAAATALPRTSPAFDFDSLDEAEFSRLTRNALSHLGDLTRLAASPLTQLPLIETRLALRSLNGDTLERANELKGLLAESIARLKPRGKGDFGTSDEWRYYNALYFPYVVGLKPYSQRASHPKLDEASRAALDWFRTSVPERTLYNWQTAAAKLIARDLRERKELQKV